MISHNLTCIFNVLHVKKCCSFLQDIPSSDHETLLIVIFSHASSKSITCTVSLVVYVPTFLSVFLQHLVLYLFTVSNPPARAVMFVYRRYKMGSFYNSAIFSLLVVVSKISSVVKEIILFTFNVRCICVSGHVAEALQTTLPDVFVSSDGGYSWSLVSHFLLC